VEPQRRKERKENFLAELKKTFVPSSRPSRLGVFNDFEGGNP